MTEFGAKRDGPRDPLDRRLDRLDGPDGPVALGRRRLGRSVHPATVATVGGALRAPVGGPRAGGGHLRDRRWAAAPSPGGARPPPRSPVLTARPVVPLGQGLAGGQRPHRDGQGRAWPGRPPARPRPGPGRRAADPRRRS